MNDRLKINKCVTTLKFKLTNAEKLEKGDLLASLDGQLSDVNGAFEQAKAKHKSVSGELESQIAKAIGCIRTGYEHREVECDEVNDYDAGIVSCVYDGETMETRRMLAHERQLRIA